MARLVAVLACLIGCSADAPASRPDAGSDGCTDLDGDGHGQGGGCASDDCDDRDPALTSQCGDPDLCADGLHVTGCGCRGDQPVSCRTSPSDDTLSGRCAAGLRRCTDGVYGPCEGEVLPAEEVCNGEDDDCDGVVDEGQTPACGACTSSCDDVRIGSGGDEPFDLRAAHGDVVLDAQGSLTLRRETSIENEVIWIANTGDGTISKLDTDTRVERGRYYTDPSLVGNPSRSAVDHLGNVVSVNRVASTATYIAASDCPDQDGDGLVATSTGRDDVLGWGADECVRWNLPIEGGGARGAAIELRVELDGEVREYAWVGAACSGDVHEIDVEAGALTGRSVRTVPPYGAAMGFDHTLWVTDRGPSMARIDTLTLDTIEYAAPGDGSFYGITVDQEGFVWLTGSSIVRFDPASETYDVHDDGGGGGVAADAEGRIWAASGDGRTSFVTRLEIASRERVHVPTSGDPVGIAIDFDGMVWAINGPQGSADVIDPRDDSVETVWHSGGRDGGDSDCFGSVTLANYTYSDMTGYQMVHAIEPTGRIRHDLQGCDAPGRPRWGALRWEADVPSGAELRLFVRTSATLAGLAEAERVRVAVVPGSASPIDLGERLALEEIEPQPYLRVEVELTAHGPFAVPVLRSLTVERVCERAFD